MKAVGDEYVIRCKCGCGHEKEPPGCLAILLIAALIWLCNMFALSIVNNFDSRLKALEQKAGFGEPAFVFCLWPSQCRPSEVK